MTFESRLNKIENNYLETLNRIDRLDELVERINLIIGEALLNLNE